MEELVVEGSGKGPYVPLSDQTGPGPNGGEHPQGNIALLRSVDHLRPCAALSS